MNIDAIHGARWAADDHSAVDLDVTLDGRRMPFTATPEDTTEHGGELWRRVVEDREVGDPAPFAPAAPTIEQIKQEAARRILAAHPEWRQRNMNMRATELQEIRLNGDTLTAEEEAEAVALKDAAAWIKTVRAASNDLEALDPIPADYQADHHWPAPPA